MPFEDGFVPGLDETKLVELLGVYGERINDVVFDLWEGSVIFGEGSQSGSAPTTDWAMILELI